MKIKSLKNWWFALGLCLPVIVFIVIYFLRADDDLIAPGFIQYDNISYISYARQYMDADTTTILYSNPFNDSGSYPKIYFQVQNFLFLLLHKASFPPGAILIFFTILCSLITFRIIISIYDLLMPGSSNRTLSIIFFSWGGGILALSGIGALPFIELSGMDNWDRIFVLDPGWGWWGLNPGRSLLFSTEAYFHAIFFGSILCILKKKWIAAILLAILLSASHPFTGVEYLSIICLWCFIEMIFGRQKIVPLWFGLSNLVVLLLHVYYYMYFLNQFGDHRSVHEQCSMNILLRFYNMIPAYAIVGALAVLSVKLSSSIKQFFSLPHNRLFTCWFIVTFLLVNHEMFMTPMQPVHFTRGYVWSSLFLLGLPALDRLLKSIKKKRYAVLILFMLTALFLSDNLLWFMNYTRKQSQTHQSIYASKEQLDVLTWLGKNTDNKMLVICASDNISLMNPVYSSSYSWVSHNLATPFRSKKLAAYNDFITTGKIDSVWYGRELVFILNKNDSSEAMRIRQLSFEPTSITTIHQYSILKTRFDHKK